MLLYPTPSSVLYPALLLLLSSSSSLTSLDDSHCAGGGPFGIQIQSVRASASSPSPLESTSTSTTHDKPPQIVLERTSSSRDNDDGRTHGDTPPPPSSFQVYDFAAGLTLLYDETIVSCTVDGGPCSGWSCVSQRRLGTHWCSPPHSHSHSYRSRPQTSPTARRSARVSTAAFSSGRGVSAGGREDSEGAN